MSIWMKNEDVFLGAILRDVDCFGLFFSQQKVTRVAIKSGIHFWRASRLENGGEKEGG